MLTNGPGTVSGVDGQSLWLRRGQETRRLAKRNPRLVTRRTPIGRRSISSISPTVGTRRPRTTPRARRRRTCSLRRTSLTGRFVVGPRLRPLRRARRLPFVRDWVVPAFAYAQSAEPAMGSFAARLGCAGEFLALHALSSATRVGPHHALAAAVCVPRTTSGRRYP